MSRALLSLLSLLLLSACATQPADPVAVMLDRDRGVSQRLSALQAASATVPADELVKAMVTLVLHDTHPDELRIAAANALAARDEAMFRKLVRERIGSIEGWPTLEHLFQLGIQRQWPEWPTVLVHSYSRPSQRFADAERPERRLLAAFDAGLDARDAAMDVLRQRPLATTLIEQVAAWQLLCRLSTQDELHRYLATESAASGVLLGDLRAASTQLGVLPRNREEVLWLRSLREPGQRAVWQRLVELVASPAVRVKPRAMRHLCGLLHADAALLAADRATLLASVRRDIADAEVHRKGVTSHDTQGTHGQTLDDWAGELDAGDLLLLRLVQLAVREPALVADLFTQADADLADDQSEHGGALLREQGRWVARSFAPLFRRHDMVYYAPPDLITTLYTGLAHYHFHAQQHANASVAGPGDGDLGFADRLGLPCVVFTFIDRDTLNVDYYHAGGVRIDLGVVRRR